MFLMENLPLLTHQQTLLVLLDSTSAPMQKLTFLTSSTCLIQHGQSQLLNFKVPNSKDPMTIQHGQLFSQLTLNKFMQDGTSGQNQSLIQSNINTLDSHIQMTQNVNLLKSNSMVSFTRL